MRQPKAEFKKSGVPVKEGRISCVFPPGGIQDNTVNRLLLMSSSERHLSSVPMAFFIEQNEPNDHLVIFRPRYRLSVVSAEAELAPVP